MSVKPKILVCPLDWGIGHATRCVPIIKELILQGADVYIGASKRPLAFLRKEFPDLPHIDFPGHEIAYPLNGNGMVLKMIAQFPAMLRWIRKEHQMLDRLIEKHHFKGIISDNRFGLYPKNIPGIFLTHQVFIKTPAHLKFLEPLIHRINQNFIKKYYECWIPDFAEKNNLSGDLSHKKILPSNYHFIGPLSRFAGNLMEEGIGKHENIPYDVLVILSGPEPQRCILEKKILSEIERTEARVAMVCGKPDANEDPQNLGKSKIFTHLESQSLLDLICSTKLVITRSGYSTIMDLATTGKRALLIPTPGQTEQEYLAKYLQSRGIYQSCSQSDFSFEKALAGLNKYTGIKLKNDKSILKNRVENFLRLV